MVFAKTRFVGRKEMTRTEWEHEYMSVMGDTILVEDTLDEDRLRRLDEVTKYSLEEIEAQTLRIRRLTALRENYVEREINEINTNHG
jgi:hypothetical protein